MTMFWNRRRSTVEELAEEMESHVLLKAEELEAAGVPADDALRQARRSFGNRALLQDRAHEIWANHPLSRLATSLRFAFVQLRRERLFACVSILILSLGIGANTAIFAGLHQAIFRKLPVTDPDSLVFVTMSGPKLHSQSLPLSYRLLSDLVSQPTEMESLSGWLHDRVMALDENNQQRSLSAMLVTGNAFSMLGVEPAIGRLLIFEDNHVEHPEIWPVVLSYNFWSTKYHREASVIGQRITVSGRPAQIVGVTPEGFEGLTPNVPIQMYLPITFFAEQEAFGKEGALQVQDYFVVTALGRLRKGVTIEEADLQLRQTTTSWLQRALQPVVALYPMLEGMSFQLSSASRGHTQQVLGDYGSTLTLLQILMAGGLLFCCVNVAGLQLARNLERAHEFAVRVALGANRGHLIQQCLMEAILIAAGGATVALPITLVVTHMLSSFLTKPGAGEIVVVHPHWGVFAMAGAFTLVCAVVVGVVPVVFAKNTNPMAVLKSKSGMKRPPSIASKILVAAQISVTFLLIATASFYWRTLHHIYEQGLGYNPSHVTEVSAQFQEMRKTPAEIMGLYSQMLHRLNAHKEIESATMTWVTQLTTVDPQINVALPEDNAVTQVSFNEVGLRYFHTLQTKLLAGREFIEEDNDYSHCIVNELAGRKVFHAGPEAVLGRHLRVSFYNEINTVCEIVGVVASAKYADIHSPPPPILFLPITSDSLRSDRRGSNMVFLIRGEREEELERTYMEVLGQVAPGTGYMRFLPMERQLNDALGKERLLSYATTFFGTIALFLCTAATLSLLLMRVRQSIPEIAIRVALGASPRHAAGIILREMLVLAIAGTAAGLFFLGAVEYLSMHYLHFQGPVALRDMGGAMGVLFAMTFVAGGVPALHAATLQPMQVLCRDS